MVLDPHPQDLRREPALATRSWQKEVVKVRSYRRSFIHTPGVLVRKRGDAGGQEGRRHWTMQVGVGGSPMRGSPVRKRGDAGGQEGRRHWAMQVGVEWVTYEPRNTNDSP